MHRQTVAKDFNASLSVKTGGIGINEVTIEPMPCSEAPRHAACGGWSEIEIISDDGSIKKEFPNSRWKFDPPD
jgi:hypothetical protein